MKTLKKQFILPQAEAERLVLLEKKYIEGKIFDFPFGGKSIMIPLVSLEGGIVFFIDVNSSQITLKYNIQNRFQDIPLIRIDLGGRHTNPDGMVLDIPHLHRYKEGEGLRNAVALPPEFGNPKDVKFVFQKFMDICSVVERPKINYMLVNNETD